MYDNSNYAALTLNYMIASALEGQNYTAKFYGENPCVNKATITANDLISTKSSTTLNSGTSGRVVLPLTMGIAFYTQYYAVITIGNYTYTTAVTIQTVEQSSISSNENTPSIVNNNNNESQNQTNRQ